MKQNNRKIGAEKETLATEFLERQGLILLEKNFYCYFGEIDLILCDGETLVFAEVKYRKDKKNGAACEAVTKKKQNTIYKCAEYYLYRNRQFANASCRFDVVEINGDDIHWLKNAFGGL